MGTRYCLSGSFQCTTFCSIDSWMLHLHWNRRCSIDSALPPSVAAAIFPSRYTIAPLMSASVPTQAREINTSILLINSMAFQCTHCRRLFPRESLRLQNWSKRFGEYSVVKLMFSGFWNSKWCSEDWFSMLNWWKSIWFSEKRMRDIRGIKIISKCTKSENKLSRLFQT